ncbi:MAG: FAD:protein FMN transferase, partial [Planctomycetales bacterium]|nr:FAD:protein FMN transferase [Planctomycetales bacterium]
DYDPDSELSRLSAASPTAQPVEVGDDLWRVMRAAERVSRESDGAFDVTVGPLTTLWRAARKTKTMPDDEMLRQALASVGHSLVELSSDRQAIALKRGGMRLDLGGIAKGYAVDEALAVLRKHGVERALVNGGGDIGASGAPPGKSGWTIGVAPLEPQAEPSMLLSLKDAAVATSGDAWQFVEIAGRRYSHIVDPHTGLGLTERIRATVVAPNCTIADAAATAVSVLGVEAGLRLITEMQGCEALLVAAEGDRIVQRETAGFAAFEAPEK